MRRSAAAEGDADGAEAVASVRPLADVIARRIVVAHPHFGSSAAGGCASYPPSVAPDNLRIVAAHATAGVGAVLVVSGFRGPIVHHFHGRGASTSDLKKIFAVG